MCEQVLGLMVSFFISFVCYHDRLNVLNVSVVLIGGSVRRLLCSSPPLSHPRARAPLRSQLRGSCARLRPTCC